MGRVILKIASPVTLQLCAETKIEPSTAASEPSSEASELSSEGSERRSDASQLSSAASELSCKAPEPSSEASEPSSEVYELNSFASCISGHPAAVCRIHNRRAAVCPPQRAFNNVHKNAYEGDFGFMLG